MPAMPMELKARMMMNPKRIIPTSAARCRKKRRRTIWPWVRATIAMPCESDAVSGTGACALSVMGGSPISGQPDARVKVRIEDVGDHVEGDDRGPGDDEERHDRGGIHIPEALDEQVS